MRRWTIAALALAHGLAAATGGSAQGDADGPTEAEPVEEIVRLEEWPALSSDERKTVRTDVERLRKAHTEEMGEQARAALIAAGAAIVPELLPKLGKEKDEDALERMDEVLAAVVGPQHTRLLAKEFSDRSMPVRTWALRAAARFPDPGTREAAEKALAKVEKRLERVEEKTREDAAEHLAASLAATAAGSLEGLSYLHVRARKGWGDLGADMRAALEAVRGPQATTAVAAHLDGERIDVVAALNLLSGCGDRETAVPIVKPHLDSSDNSIRIAAINALRGIVDGEPPVDKLPVFEAIELAKRWKARV